MNVNTHVYTYVYVHYNSYTSLFQIDTEVYSRWPGDQSTRTCGKPRRVGRSMHERVHIYICTHICTYTTTRIRFPLKLTPELTENGREISQLGPEGSCGG